MRRREGEVLAALGLRHTFAATGPGGFEERDGATGKPSEPAVGNVVREVVP